MTPGRGVTADPEPIPSLSSATSLPSDPPNPAGTPKKSEPEDPPAPFDLTRRLGPAEEAGEGDLADRLLQLFLPGCASEEAREQVRSFLAEGRPTGKHLRHRVREAAHAVLCSAEFHLA